MATMLAADESATAGGRCFFRTERDPQVVPRTPPEATEQILFAAAAAVAMMRVGACTSVSRGIGP